MSPGEVRGLLERNPEALLLDVRQPEEWTPPLGHIEGAKLIPLPELNARLSEIEAWRDRPIVAVCRSGRRSEIARKALLEAGFTNVANMEGGMIEWRKTE
jgi:rhodanese-related sulfurtransferase